jgi:Transposase IS4
VAALTKSKSDAVSQDSDSGQAQTPSVGWTQKVTSTVSSFQPSASIGPKSAAANCSANTSSGEFFGLFWGDKIWQLIVEKTNFNASPTIAHTPNNYYAGQWSPLTITELKAFVGLRLSMEYSVIKRRYESYFSRRVGFVFQTPGYRKVMSRDHYLAIWKFLHVVDEENSDVDKQDKLYKILP